MASAPVTQLPPQTTRDIRRDNDNCAHIERLAAAETPPIVLRSRERSDHHVKWLLSEEDAARLPRSIKAQCVVWTRNRGAVLGLPRSYEKLTFRWVDAVPFIWLMLLLAFVGNAALYFYRKWGII